MDLNRRSLFASLTLLTSCAARVRCEKAVERDGEPHDISRLSVS